MDWIKVLIMFLASLRCPSRIAPRAVLSTGYKNVLKSPKLTYSSFSGNRIFTVVPCPCSESTNIRPRCAMITR